MMDHEPDYRLVCTWGPRPQSAQEVAHDVLRCSAHLLEACPELGAWHYLGRKDALMPQPQNVDEVRAVVLACGNNARGTPPPDLLLPVGFDALLLTAKSQGASWMAHIGSGVDMAWNRVSLTLPRKGPLMQALTKPATMERLFRTMIALWRPDWATVSHTDMADPDPAAPVPVHWLLYGREPLPPGLALPPGATLCGAAGEEVLPGLPLPGSYLRTTPSGERFNYAIPAHQATCENLKAVLRQAGWLPVSEPADG